MPDLFLSYSRDDNLTMGVIRDNLRKLGFNLWIDIEYLKPGAPQWERAVKRAIGKTDGMLVLCSPSAEQSVWVNREIHMAGVARKPVIPVLIAGEEWDAIPAGLMGDQYCDMRERSGPDRGFRELVASLADYFDFQVPDYDLESADSMQVPAVQVIDIHGHVEGQVIAIGRDVEGDIHQEKIAPTPGIPQRPGKEPGVASDPVSTLPSRRKVPTWAWRGGAVIGSVLLIGVLALSGMLGGGGLTLGLMPTATSIPTPTETSLPPGFNPVNRNANWRPVIQDFDNVEMALVPMGCFMMGSTVGEINEAFELCEGRYGDCNWGWFEAETPQHEVCFEEPFWIDVTEVTNGQFAEFGGEAGSESHRADADGPREQITWHEALAFCQLRGARLPTEAEWEYSARGPDGLIYPWGNEFIADYVVYSGNSGGQMAEVGSRVDGISWVGAYDMSGNVWEWMADRYGEAYYSTLLSPAINPQGPNTGSYRVTRGGSWGLSTFSLRGAYRSKIYPGISDHNDLGFRCALSYGP